MLLYYLVIGPVVLLVYASAAVLPSWRWMMGSVALGGTLLFLGIWLLPEKPVTSLPEGEGRAYAAIMGVGFVIVYFSALAAKLITLFFEWRRIPSLILHAVLFALLLSAPDLQHRISWAYKTWPASDACRSAIFEVDVAGLGFAIAPSPLFAIHAGNATKHEVFSLVEPIWQRKFCATYDNGRKKIDAISLSVQYLSFPGPKEFCSKPPDWARLVCTGTWFPPRPWNRNGTNGDFPLNAQIFSASGTAVAGPLSTAIDASGPLPGAQSISIRSHNTTSDGNPLTFACSISMGEKNVAQCRVAYPWREGAYIGYTFFAPSERIEEFGLRYDAAVHQVFEKLLKS